MDALVIGTIQTIEQKIVWGIQLLILLKALVEMTLFLLSINTIAQHKNTHKNSSFRFKL